jgi:hypothetical protein
LKSTPSQEQEIPRKHSTEVVRPFKLEHELISWQMAPQRKKAKTAAYAEAQAAAAAAAQAIAENPTIHPELAAVKVDPALLHPDLSSSQPTELSPGDLAAIAAAAAAARPLPDANANSTNAAPAPTAAGTTKQPRQRKNAAPASRAAIEAAAALHQQQLSSASSSNPLADLAKSQGTSTDEPTVSVDAAAEFLRTIQEREAQKNHFALQAHQPQHTEPQHGEPIIAADGSIPTDLASLYPQTAAVAHVQAPQQTFSNDGFPSPEQFADMVNEYLSSLSPKKQTKALLTQAMYDDIREVLLHPTETKTGTAQFRFWSKKMFKLVSVSSTHIVIHENKPVATKEQLYDVLVQCHGQAEHGGRDKTATQVRKFYSWVPKELIARFVKACPSCVRPNTSSNS